MEKITYKQVLDTEGDVEYLELWQGENFIKISLSSHGTHTNGYRWEEVKKVVDFIATTSKDHTEKRLYSRLGLKDSDG